MADELEIIYPCELTCEFICLSEFFKLMGIYVYATSMEYPGWQQKTENNGIKQKLFLLSTREQAAEVIKCRAAEKLYLLYGEKEEFEQINFDDSLLFKSGALIQLIQKISREHGCENFAGDFFEYYKNEKLYRCVYLVENLRQKMPLMVKCEETLQRLLTLLKDMEEKWKCDAYYYTVSYICLLCNRIDQLYERKRAYSFYTLVSICNQAKNSDTKPFCELKGDIYFSFEQNYIIGLLYYEKSLADYNDTSPLKIAEYWQRIADDPDRTEHYLRMSRKNNKENYLAAVRLGRYYENLEKGEKALEIYQEIIAGLRQKAEKNFLLPVEFGSLCIAHKRKGCNIYKKKENPDYSGAIEDYREIYKLWNACSENGFIRCFPKEDQGDIADYYRRQFDIRRMIGSLSKIYDLYGDSKRSDYCWSVFQDMDLTDLRILPENIF